MKWIFDFFEQPIKNGSIINNRYKIKQCLGKGGYGLVYQALDVITNNEVVMKQLRRRKMRSKSSLESFKKEAMVLKKLNHPSIPKWIDDFEDENHQFIVMESIYGQNVEDLIFREGKIYDEEEAFRILVRVLEIVQYFHEKGIVHRDLRIPNIIMNESQIYIIDFGLAKTAYECSFTDDFYDLGHFVLFLLYSSYKSTSRKEKSWEEELSLSQEAKAIIRRMLKIDQPYERVEEIIGDIQHVSNQAG